MGDLIRAEADYTKALLLDPGLTRAYLNRGRVYLDQAEYSAALDDYKKALKRDPESELARSRIAEAYLERGKMRLEQGQSDAARGDFEAVLEIDPSGSFSSTARTYLKNLSPEAEESLE
jgi:Tfp pilus assembly protein PilF